MIGEHTGEFVSSSEDAEQASEDKCKGTDRVESMRS